MKVVFLSNYFNHHQEFLSLAFKEKKHIEYYFIATSPITSERLDMGYADSNKKYEWIICSYESLESYNLAQNLINNADIVIIGSAPYSMIKNRLKDKKVTFLYTERIYKKRVNALKFLGQFIKMNYKYRFRSNMYLLCAGAYVFEDFSKYGLFKNKALKWGYFPEIKIHNNLMQLIDNKSSNSLLWAGRLIDWKHPELAIKVAKNLKDDGYDFNLTIVGCGTLECKLKESIERLNLNNYVTMVGAKSPEEVREYMEASEIYLFTSDRNEGWGAVLNEAMNSVCAVVANKDIGSVPYMLNTNDNGLIYNGDFEDLYNKVKYLLVNKNERIKLSLNAYKTVIEEWNADNAVDKLCLVFDNIVNKGTIVYSGSGVCDKA